MKTFRVPCMRVDTPEIAASPELLGRYAGRKREHLVVLHLDADLQAVCVQRVARGTMFVLNFEMHDVFRKAIIRDTKFLVIAHNHPYEDKVKVSRVDRELTRKFREAGLLLGIPVLDHLVLCKNDFYSFCKHGVVVAKSDTYVLPEDLLARRESKVGCTHFRVK